MSACAWGSEHESQAELNDSRVCSSAASQARDLSERGASECRDRLAKVGRVGQVENFRPELQAYFLPDAERFRCIQIKIDQPGPFDRIAARIPVLKLRLQDIAA